jgi:hypothetical protein
MITKTARCDLPAYCLIVELWRTRHKRIGAMVRLRNRPTPDVTRFLVRHKGLNPFVDQSRISRGCDHGERKSCHSERGGEIGAAPAQLFERYVQAQSIEAHASIL